MSNRKTELKSQLTEAFAAVTDKDQSWHTVDRHELIERVLKRTDATPDESRRYSRYWDFVQTLRHYKIDKAKDKAARKEAKKNSDREAAARARKEKKAKEDAKKKEVASSTKKRESKNTKSKTYTDLDKTKGMAREREAQARWNEATAGGSGDRYLWEVDPFTRPGWEYPPPLPPAFGFPPPRPQHLGCRPPPPQPLMGWTWPFDEDRRNGNSGNSYHGGGRWKRSREEEEEAKKKEEERRKRAKVMEAEAKEKDEKLRKEREVSKKVEDIRKKVEAARKAKAAKEKEAGSGGTESEARQEENAEEASSGGGVPGTPACIPRDLLLTGDDLRHVGSGDASAGANPAESAASAIASVAPHDVPDPLAIPARARPVSEKPASAAQQERELREQARVREAARAMAAQETPIVRKPVPPKPSNGEEKEEEADEQDDIVEVPVPPKPPAPLISLVDEDENSNGAPTVLPPGASQFPSPESASTTPPKSPPPPPPPSSAPKSDSPALPAPPEPSGSLPAPQVAVLCVLQATEDELVRDLGEALRKVQEIKEGLDQVRLLRSAILQGEGKSE